MQQPREEIASPMVQLKCNLSKVAELITRGRPIAYLDYPVHDNIGDLLIMLGTERFFEDYQFPIEFRAMGYMLDPPRRGIGTDTVICLHGGGNFGDVHPLFQRFREYVVQKYPKNKIVMFPQTLHYANISRMKETVQIYSKHQDLHICVRDKQSYSRSTEVFLNPIYLVPDMAHQLWPHGPNDKWPLTEANQARLFLLRDDVEQHHLDVEFRQRISAQDFSIMDWSDIVGFTRTQVSRFLRLAHKGDWYLGQRLPLAVIWKIFAEHLVDRAIQEYSRYEEVVTSRLHGHILACLMGKRSVLLDNSYGKNAAYYWTWTHSIPGARFGVNAIDVSTLNELRDHRVEFG